MRPGYGACLRTSELAGRGLFYGFAWLLVLAAGFGYFYGRSLWVPVYQSLIGKRSLEQVMERYGPGARARLLPHFRSGGISYPPAKVTLLVLKHSARLELWADGLLVRDYQIQALSGQAGPKLREGDRQVPEGFYRIVGLNPNSAYHLSLKLNYPNAFDLQQAAAEGRTKPGSNIFLHGKAVSIGCLAMGDRTIEELFVLAHDVGLGRIEVAIAPRDPRLARLDPSGHPVWVAGLYRNLERYFQSYRTPAAPASANADPTPAVSL